MKSPATVLIFALLFSFKASAAPEWHSLFDGHTLEGWKVVDGVSPVLIDDGQIVAINQNHDHYVYLITEESYSDFILELDFKIIGDLNSGILIRGISDPNIKGGKIRGYQMEIDQSPRQWTGGIYEEGGRAWLYSLEGREEMRKAYKPSEWNRYRIEAIGDSLKTWVNGIPTCNLKDDATASGVIGFQIHKVTDDLKGGAFYVRNIRIRTEELEPLDMDIPQETAPSSE